MSFHGTNFASRDGVSSTCSPAPFQHVQARRSSNPHNLQSSLDLTAHVPSPDVIHLLPATAPQYVSNSETRWTEDASTPEPVRQSTRLKSKPTLRYSADGIYLPTPESTPPLTESDTSVDWWNQDSPTRASTAGSSTTPSPNKHTIEPTAAEISNHAARLSNMSSFLTYLEQTNLIAKTTTFSAPLAYSHNGSFTTTFASLREHLLHRQSLRRRLQLQHPARRLRSNKLIRQDELLSFMEASLGITPCTIPFTQARNTTDISFMPSIVSTIQEHELHDRQDMAGLFDTGLYIAPDETARLEALTSGPGSERFVFGGAGAKSGQIHGDSALVGVWYRVLDGALKITVTTGNAGQQEETILVDRDVSIAVVMLGRVHEVAAVDLAAGGRGALASGAVLFVTGLVPMTRFYSRRELGKVCSGLRVADGKAL